MFGFDCSKCQHDPKLKDQWGCEQPKQVAVWADPFGEDTYKSCPILFVSGSIADWYRAWVYDKDMGTGLPYAQQSARFVEAIGVYQAWLNRFMSEKNRPRKAGPSLGDLKAWRKQ